MNNIFSDNKNFYPTPKELVDKMYAKIKSSDITYVLEPSAGKGDIIDRIYSIHYDRPLQVDAIEIEPELQKILKAKENAFLVASDFLAYQTLKYYDLIIMNPPFDDGDKHLLKAIELMKNGGQIVCLLNAETIKNSFSNTRKLLKNKLAELCADIEFLSSAFTQAERKTDTEIALVYINIPRVIGKSKIWENMKNAHEFIQIEQGANKEVIERNLIQNIVSQYEMEVNAGQELIREYKALTPYILDNTNNQEGYPILELKFKNNKSYKEINPNEYMEQIRLKYWRALFDRDEIQKMLTSEAHEKYYNNINEMKSIEFNVENIMQLRINLNKELYNTVQKTILDIFDTITVKHSWYDDNSKTIHYFNGWRTNKCYKIDKKAILPWNAHDSSCNYQIAQKLNDIDKCLAYFDSALNIQSNTLSHIDKELQNKRYSIQCRYFNIIFYKKGTCHIIFTNDDLVKKLNIFVARNRNWLPPSYTRKPYNKMDTEERRVIDSFEGETSYNEVYENKDEYMPVEMTFEAIATV